LVIDKAAGVDLESRPFTQIRVPRLLDADWAAGTCPVIET
jgi:hypothetical protein